jgi:chemotaxis signal transduction protein
MQSLLKHMPQVQDYVRRLESLQETWGNLALLSQMAGNGTDLAETRKAFEALSQELVAHLTAETARKVVAELAARAQVAIDVLVRNLFERTADIGFLAIDDDIVQFMADWAKQGTEVEPAAAAALRDRFGEYAAKYSVYGNVVLLAPDGRVLVQLDERNATTRSADPLVGRTLASAAAYVESFGATDLVHGDAPVLVYSYRVEDQRRALGVLALCFRFEDELRAIFGKLRNGEDDWTVVALLDAEGKVLASSDPWQLPVGAPLAMAAETEGRVVRFAGREYLAVTRPTTGYQGYMGPPGWFAHAMVPLEHAFGQQAGSGTSLIDPALLAAAHQGASIFPPALRAIPQRADHIQRELNRSVWNGNLRDGDSSGGRDFSGVLLQEISATGRRTQELFARSIGDLQETVMSSLLQEGAFRASLAAEILDRNLYERANDCRWWALNGTLRRTLEGKAGADAATRILEQINALYTVYDHILLFDRERRVVAVSSPRRADAVGTQLAQGWATEALSLRDSQAWIASRYEPLASYDDRPTWVFAAAVRGHDGFTRGGIAVVFDAAPQVAAMLRDVLPQAEGVVDVGSVALFVDGEARVLAASSGYEAGATLPLPSRLRAPGAAGAVDILELPDGYYAAGARSCTGYREFPGLDVTAIVLRKLGARGSGFAVVLPHPQFGSRVDSGTAVTRVAIFASGGQWLAVPAAQVVEAVQGGKITRMPGGAAWYPGVVNLGGRMVPVVDLAQWYRTKQRGAANIIVVVQQGESRVGLLVDQLGDVLSVGAGDIVEVAVDAAQGAVATTRVVKFADTREPTLPLVDVAVLLGRLRG